MSDAATIVLNTICGACWTTVYLSIIHRGFRDKTCGMPAMALFLNLAWEITFGFLFPPESAAGTAINIIWALLDLIILLTFVKYGFKLYNDYGISKLQFYFFIFGGLVISFIIMIGGYLLLENVGGFFENRGYVALIAFIQNAVMSILFVRMFYSRNNLDGQSLYVAIFKMSGSAAIGVFWMIENPSDVSVVILFISTFIIFDIYYIVILYREMAFQELDMWKRF